MISEIQPNVKLLYVAPENAEEVIAQNRWFCKNNQRTTPSREDVMRSVKAALKTAHLGLLEHCIASFELTMSRVSSHQLVRHRMASYAQHSQRSILQEPTIILPCLDSETRSKLVALANTSYEAYLGFIEQGMSKENARYILPQCFTTKVRMTADFRTLIHFLRLRLHSTAQEEINTIALLMQTVLEKNCPFVFSKDSIKTYLEVPG